MGKGLKFMGNKKVEQQTAVSYLGATTDEEAINIINAIAAPPVAITVLATAGSGIQVMLSTMCTPEIALELMNRASSIILDKMQKANPEGVELAPAEVPAEEVQE